MTPRRLEPDVLHSRLRVLRGLLDDLEAVGAITAERLIDDRLLRHGIERILTAIVDLAVSINGHVSAAVLGRGPSDYRDSFRQAAAAGVITSELAERLAPSASMRNVIVHAYIDVDLSIVAKAVPRALTGYRQYVAEVARFLRQPA